MSWENWLSLEGARNALEKIVKRLLLPDLMRKQEEANVEIKQAEAEIKRAEAKKADAEATGAQTTVVTEVQDRLVDIEQKRLRVLEQKVDLLRKVGVSEERIKELLDKEIERFHEVADAARTLLDYTRDGTIVRARLVDPSTTDPSEEDLEESDPPEEDLEDR